MAGHAGTAVTYLKPHGALYNRTVADQEQAAPVAEVAARLRLPVLGLPGSRLLRHASSGASDAAGVLRRPCVRRPRAVCLADSGGRGDRRSVPGRLPRPPVGHRRQRHHDRGWDPPGRGRQHLRARRQSRRARTCPSGPDGADGSGRGGAALHLTRQGRMGACTSTMWGSGRCWSRWPT
ncbi:MAG: LamB/YcsF family protein [Nocardioidaceae bacterium]|nr:LamB/YcsF family protein [Nocardioidaceae bacterium]